VNRLIVDSTIATDQSRPGGGASSSTVSESTLGPPSAVVAVTRTVLVPAVNATPRLWVVQFVHAPVPVKATSSAIIVPLTLTRSGRLVDVPLAYRMIRFCVPVAAAVTVHSTALPTWLLKLTKPVPVKPAWSLSTTPLTISACSAS